MLIGVTIEQTQPLKGSAATDDERSVSFVGWLDLLRAIAELTEATERPVAQTEASNGRTPCPGQ